MSQHDTVATSARSDVEAVADTPSLPSADSQEYVGSIVAFRLGELRYALPMSRVQEIQQIVAFSAVPGGGPALLGMVNLRGHVIPAVDLRRLLGLEARTYTLQTPMVLCRVRGQVAAFVVDEVLDVIALPDGSLQAAPPLHALSAKMIGVCRLETGLVYLLEPDLVVPASTLADGE